MFWINVAASFVCPATALAPDVVVGRMPVRVAVRTAVAPPLAFLCSVDTNPLWGICACRAVSQHGGLLDRHEPNSEGMLLNGFYTP